MSEYDKYRDKGRQYFKEGNYKKSLEFFSKAIECYKENNDELHVLYSNRSAAFLALEKLDSALEDAERTINIKPEWSKVYWIIKWNTI